MYEQIIFLVRVFCVYVYTLRPYSWHDNYAICCAIRWIVDERLCSIFSSLLSFNGCTDG